MELKKRISATIGKNNVKHFSVNRELFINYKIEGFFVCFDIGFFILNQ